MCTCTTTKLRHTYGSTHYEEYNITQPQIQLEAYKLLRKNCVMDPPIMKMRHDTAPRKISTTSKLFSGVRVGLSTFHILQFYIINGCMTLKTKGLACKLLSAKGYPCTRLIDLTVYRTLEPGPIQPDATKQSRTILY
eukprot:863959-Pelagomonas_calceolata.AAC.4